MTYAVQINIYPSQIHLKGIVNNSVCYNFSINTNGATLSGKIKWTKSLLINKDIIYYNLKSKDIGILEEYPNEIITIKKENYSLCLIFPRIGKYNGALIYSGKNNIAGIGVWITADIINNKNNQNLNSNINNLTDISGSFFYLKDKLSNKKTSFILITIFLFVCLYFLIKTNKRT